jgi:DNA-binding SARP family transcriptional activator/tetratricopeptide (TPR) repeat protein
VRTNGRSGQLPDIETMKLMHGVAFGILGALVVRGESGPVPVGEPRRRAVLGVLLLDAGRTVLVDRLATLVWGTDPPATARKALQVYVSQLRRALAGLSGVELHTDLAGYRLACEPDTVDLHRFRRLVRRARDGAGPRRESLREALALWRGPAFADVGPGPLRESVAPALEEERLGALEDLCEADIAAGDGPHAVGPLMSAVAEHPLRERMAGLLMTALHQGGRGVEATRVYRALRQRLVDDAGMEPSPYLAELHRAILAGGVTAPAGRPAVPVRPAPPPVAAQLPARRADFRGRADVLARLDELSAGADGAGPVVLVITGTAGVGKTATAVQWAHRVLDRFPDGQLFADLRGYSPGPPARPIDVHAAFLRALAVPPERVPADVAEAAAMFRSIVAGRRMLVLLDNARDAEQVRPLLPGGTTGAVIVTSRNDLTGLVALDGATALSLDMLPADDAYHLLAGVLGADRTVGQAAAVKELVALCARLPLALRIAGARLAGQPGRPVADYVAELRDGDRLGELQVDGDPHAAVRGAFALSYRALPAPARRLFRRLGLAPGVTVTTDAAAALAGVVPAHARRLLAQLVRASLLDPVGPDRYAMHDLLHLYAAEQARAEDGADRIRLAEERLFRYLLLAVDAAARFLYPHMVRAPVADLAPSGGDRVAWPAFADRAAALAWLDAERPTLVAAVHQFAAHGAPAHAWRLADSLRGYYHLRMHAAEWLAMAQTAAAAARTDGDPRGQASAHLDLALMPWHQGRHGEAITHYRHALRFAVRAGWVQAEAAALGQLGNLYRQTGSGRRAAEMYRRVIQLSRRTGNLASEAVSAGNLGLVFWEQGRLAQAVDQYEMAMPLLRKIGSASAEAVVLANLSEAKRALGQLDVAVRFADAARTLTREVGHRPSEGDILRCEAAIHLDAGRYEAALGAAQQALLIAQEVGHARFEGNALNVIGAVELATGRWRQAADRYREALDAVDPTADRYPHLVATVGLADAQRLIGATDEANAAITAAITAAGPDGYGYRLVEARARTVRAELCLAAGDLDVAEREARRSLRIQVRAGYLLGQVRTRKVLMRVLARAGRRRAVELQQRRVDEARAAIT